MRRFFTTENTEGTEETLSGFFSFGFFFVPSVFSVVKAFLEAGRDVGWEGQLCF